MQLQTGSVVDVHVSLFIGLEYYLSDASGLPITKDGNIVLHNRDGSSETHVWTLTSWLNISGIRYQSRAKLFCVEKSTRE